MCKTLGIVKQSYDEAYKIYDFRNSGKSGYGLVDGKIQVVDESLIKQSPLEGPTATNYDKI